MINKNQDKSEPLSFLKIADPAIKQYIYCKQGSNIVYVSNSHRFNPLVSSFLSAIKRNNPDCTVEYIDLQSIAKMWNIGPAKVDISEMQRYAKTIFEKAVILRASDIHIRCNEKGITGIFMRVHGDIRFIEEQTFEVGSQLCAAIYQAMTDVSDSTFEPLSRQDARIADPNKMPVALDGIRVATTPQIGGFLMVLRLLYNDTVDSLELESLGYTSKQATVVQKMKGRPTGINIIAGPTGSGKSTSLQRILTSIASETQGRKHIITVEDPPEYPIQGAVQTPVTNAGTDEERGRAFQAAIKATMRLDPDIIMIGEIRDTASAQLAVRAAMTGHQVWATLHASSALGIFERLLDLGISIDLLTDPGIVSGLSCQRLLKKLCPNCKVPYFAHREHLDLKLLSRLEKVPDIEKCFFSGGGCSHCGGSGTTGRTVVAETLLTDPGLMKFILGRDRQGALGYWQETLHGMSMAQHAFHKVMEGEVDLIAAEEIVGEIVPEQGEALC
jgi:general secretion pathway protein E